MGVVSWLTGANLKIAALAVGAAALSLPLGYCEGYKAASSKYEAAAALVKTKAMERDAHARDSADSSRAADALSISKHEQELVDAISEVPDDKPDAVRVALGCQRLRGQGTPESGLPSICRP